MLRSVQARAMRTAISPRLAISTLVIRSPNAPGALAMNSPIFLHFREGRGLAMASGPDQHTLALVAPPSQLATDPTHKYVPATQAQLTGVVANPQAKADNSPSMQMCLLSPHSRRVHETTGCMRTPTLQCTPLSGNVSAARARQRC